MILSKKNIYLINIGLISVKVKSIQASIKEINDFLMNKENSMLIFYFDVVVDDYGVKVVDLGADIVQY